jgi:hypothetical protein
MDQADELLRRAAERVLVTHSLPHYGAREHDEAIDELAAALGTSRPKPAPERTRARCRYCPAADVDTESRPHGRAYALHSVPGSTGICGKSVGELVHDRDLFAPLEEDEEGDGGRENFERWLAAETRIYITRTS